MQYYTVYEVTNTVNGKTYVGVHQTNNPYDEYMGSGSAIKLAHRKYDKHRFVKKVLAIYDNPDDMFSHEAEIVTEEYVSRSDTYNLVTGGLGGGNKTDDHKEKIRKSLKSPEVQNKLRENNFARRDPDAQRIHASRAASMPKTDEHKKNISKSLKGKYSGKRSKNAGLIRKRVTCPHCGKSGAMNTMSRWHFDNCKSE